MTKKKNSFMLVHMFKLVAFKQFRLLTLHGLMSFLQLANGSFHYNSTHGWNHIVQNFVPFHICLQLQVFRNIDTNFAKID